MPFRSRKTGIFKCYECEKIFNIPHDRDRHWFGIHLSRKLGIKPFGCPLCEKRGIHSRHTRVGDVRKHLRSFNRNF